TDFDLVSAADSVERTKTGAMLGSYLFMAPEQMQDAKEADARADVYGLGMTALFCFHGAALPAIAHRRPDKGIAGLSCGEAIKAVLTKAIELEPADRYPDARALCEALREAEREDEPPAPEEPTPAPEPVLPLRKAAFPDPASSRDAVTEGA